MRVADLTIKQMASICRKHTESITKCKEKCPFFTSTDACFLARKSVNIIDDKISMKYIEKEIDPCFIEPEIINEEFYMNRFMEVS